MYNPSQNIFAEAVQKSGTFEDVIIISERLDRTAKRALGGEAAARRAQAMHEPRRVRRPVNGPCPNQVIASLREDFRRGGSRRLRERLFGRQLAVS